jgi:hypothetical protein
MQYVRFRISSAVHNYHFRVPVCILESTRRGFSPPSA